MIQYKISAGERVPDRQAEDRTDLFSFRVTDGVRVAAYSAHATGSLAAVGSLSDVDWPMTLSMVAIDQIERMLLAGACDLASGLHRWEVDDEETILRFSTSSKQCDFRRRAEPRGLLCTATTSGNPEPTTLPLCDTCDLPDARLVCSGLVHAATAYSDGAGFVPFDESDRDRPAIATPSRSVEKAFCEVHLSPQKWSECRPWMRDCWHRIVEIGVINPTPDRESPRRIIDEIEYLRLVYADRFGVRPREFWPSAEPTAYGLLLDPVIDRKAFDRHLVVLDGILNTIQPHGQLEEARRKNGKRVAGVTALGRVLEDHVDGADASYVQRLKAVKTLRNSFSHESSSEVVSAFRQLGVEPYPPRDWQLAWWQVTASVAVELAVIRSALQTGSEEDVSDTVH